MSQLLHQFLTILWGAVPYPPSQVVDANSISLLANQLESSGLKMIECTHLSDSVPVCRLSLPYQFIAFLAKIRDLCLVVHRPHCVLIYIFFQFLAFPCGLIRGALSNLGLSCSVSADVLSMPKCKLSSLHLHCGKVGDIAALQ